MKRSTLFGSAAALALLAPAAQAETVTAAVTARAFAKPAAARSSASSRT